MKNITPNNATTEERNFAKFASYMIYDVDPNDGFTVYLKLLGKAFDKAGREGYLLEAFYSKITDPETKHIDTIDIFILDRSEAIQLFLLMIEHEVTVLNLIDVAKDLGINFEIIDRNNADCIPA